MKKILLVLGTLALFGCAGQEALKDSQSMIQSGNEEQGLARLEEAMKANPNDVEIRNYYLRHKAVAVQRYLQAGDNARAAGYTDHAEAAYQRAQRFDPANANAQAGLEAVARDRASAALVKEAEEALSRQPEVALAKAQEVLKTNPSQRDARAIVRKVEEQRVRADATSPQLAAALKNTITIELKDAPVRTVFELISKRAGLNFVYDRDVPPDLRVTVFVQDTTIEEVIRFVLVTSQLERRVLNPNTVLIYPNSPAKTQAYRELTVKSFYLANADAKQTANMLRSLVKTRDLYVDEKLNMIVVRDTPEAVRMAEKLIANQDLGEAEVMLEVEVLEVGHNQLTQAGVQWPGQVSLGVMGAVGIAGQLTGTEAKNLNSGLFRLNVGDPLVALNLRQQAGRTNVLANPRIRVKSKEKARIHIGDKVPVITTTAGATGFVSESVNYLDVGLKLEVEPAGEPRGRRRHQDRPGGEQHLAGGEDRRRHRRLPGRHAQRQHHAAPARRRDPGARRPDQRRGPPQRQPGAGRLAPAADRPPVLQQQRHGEQDRDRAADHAARDPQHRAPGRAPGGVQLRHRARDRRAARRRARAAAPARAAEPRRRKRPTAGRRPTRSSSSHRSRSQAVKGFTLIELLIVVAIVALLASIAAPLAELGSSAARSRSCATRCARSARRSTPTSAPPTRAGSRTRPTPPAIPPTLAPLVEGVAKQDKPAGRASSTSCAAFRRTRSPARNGACAATPARPTRPAAGQGRLRRLLAQRRHRPEQRSVQRVVGNERKPGLRWSS